MGVGWDPTQLTDSDVPPNVDVYILGLIIASPDLGRSVGAVRSDSEPAGGESCCFGTPEGKPHGTRDSGAPASSRGQVA